MSFMKKLKISKHLPTFIGSNGKSASNKHGNNLNNNNNIGGGNYNTLPMTNAYINVNNHSTDTITNNINNNNVTSNSALNDSVASNTMSSGNNNTLTSNTSGKHHANVRCLIIYHIDSETEGTLSLYVKNDDNGETILDRVCEHYSLSNYKEYFGLKYTLVDEKGDHEIFWLDPFKLIGKQLKNTNNMLTFRVKHFPGKPHLIESEYVRYLIFLQIRNYLLKGDLQLSLTDETRLAAYAVQAYLGDYDSDLHKEHYLSELKFLSRKSLKAEETIVELHKELSGKTPAEMELAFLEKVSQFDTYGAELIVVKNSKGVEINFGVSHNGIITFLHGQSPNTAKIGLYPWTQIGKISFENRTLKVHAHTPDLVNPEIIKKQVMIFKCNSRRICKHLWKFILDQKAFFNFKRGSDVPKIKSSNSFFSHKSKFRFSGRCESELITSQFDNSMFTISPFSVSSTGGDTNSISKTNTLPSTNRSINMGTFKRRTFLNSYRSSTLNPLAGPGAESLNSNRLNDSNNNNLLLKRVDDQTTTTTNANTNSTSNANFSTGSTGHQAPGEPQLTVIVTNASEPSNIDSSSPNSSDLYSKQNLTSTPQSTASSSPSQSDANESSKQQMLTTAESNLDTSSQSKRLLDVVDNHSTAANKTPRSSLSSESKKYMLNAISKNLEHYDDDDHHNHPDDANGEQFSDHIGEDNHHDEEKFYDHDELTEISKQFVTNHNPPLPSVQNSSMVDPHHLIDKITSVEPIGSPKKPKYSIYSVMTITLIGCFAFIFTVSLCKYTHCWYTGRPLGCNMSCTLSNSIVSTVNGISQRVGSFLPFVNRSANYRWISWPLGSTSAAVTSKLNLDPLVSWFFSKYEAN